MNDSNPSTRKHPRSLQEAFKDADYANPYELPDRRYSVVWWACISIICVVTCYLIAVSL